MLVKLFVDGEERPARVETKIGRRPRWKRLPRWLSWLPGYWEKYTYKILTVSEVPSAGQRLSIRYETESPFDASGENKLD